MEKRLFLDLDGTLAEFIPQRDLSVLYQKEYFLNLRPHYNVIAAIQKIMWRKPDIPVYILSSFLEESEYALEEKNRWLDIYLPEIEKERRIFVPCGKKKNFYVPGGVQNKDFLLDDYTRNLIFWSESGVGIKLLNNINHTKGTWKKDRIFFLNDPELLADEILGIMDGIFHVFDTAENTEKKKGKKTFMAGGYDKRVWEIKAEQTKQQMKEMVFNLADSYVANPEAIAEFLAFSSRFYNYSARNSMLIFSQNRNAAFVQSFQGWKSMGANVRKGQKGIKIFVPVQKTFLQVGENRVPLSQADKGLKEAYKRGEVKSYKQTFFKIGNVFDLSQTDFPKERYPELISMGIPDEYHARAFEAVKEFAITALSCPVSVKDIQSVTLRGYYKQKGHEIVINHLLDDTQKLSTLAHETGHAMIHQNISDKSAAQVEFEGDCVGIMLESKFGIKPTDIRKKHLSDNFHVLQNELQVAVENGAAASVPDALDKIFSNVYSVYSEYTNALDNCMEKHISMEELTQHKETYLEHLIKDASPALGLESSHSLSEGGFEI